MGQLLICMLELNNLALKDGRVAWCFRPLKGNLESELKASSDAKG